MIIFVLDFVVCLFFGHLDSDASHVTEKVKAEEAGFVQSVDNPILVLSRRCHRFVLNFLLELRIGPDEFFKLEST